MAYYSTPYYGYYPTVQPIPLLGNIFSNRNF